MTLFRTLLILLIAAIFTACTEYGDFERRLAVADSLMTHELPDSAYRMLCGMDAEAEEVSEPLRMRHLLLRSNAQNKAYVDFTSDSIGCLLVNYYNAHGTPNERMLAHYIKGCAYRDMGDQPASLRCYNDAVAAADTSRADCNYDQSASSTDRLPTFSTAVPCPTMRYKPTNMPNAMRGRQKIPSMFSPSGATNLMRLSTKAKYRRPYA